MTPAFSRRDALLRQTQALPDDAGDVTSPPVDLQVSGNGHLVARLEFELTVPALATEELPDDETAVYDVIHSDSADMSNPEVLYPGFVTQLGAAGAGAAGLTKRFAVPSDVRRYVAIVCTTTAAETDASAQELVLDVLF